VATLNTGLADFSQILTRNSLMLSLKFPKFHRNSLDFAQSNCYFHPGKNALLVPPLGILKNRLISTTTLR